MTLKLDKVNRGPHLSTLVASSISREIAQGRLKPGDQLPTEAALATTFGVSRNVVREAIAQLRADGMVEARQGIGSFVLAPEQRAAIRIDRETLKEGQNMERLFELRCILEAESAALAAERRDQEHLDWVRRQRASVPLMASVCTGSLVFAAAGLLTGRRATTHWASLNLLSELDPTVITDVEARFVDDGDLITAAFGPFSSYRRRSGGSRLGAKPRFF